MRLRNKTTIAVLVFIFVGLSLFISFTYKKPISYEVTPKSPEFHQGLLANLEYECIQNSDCDAWQECVKNVCINTTLIDKCATTPLYNPLPSLRIGNPINSDRRVLTEDNLPYVLMDGLIPYNVSNESEQIDYVQTFKVGSNLVIDDGGTEKVQLQTSYLDPVYSLMIYFSNPVDFSDGDIQGNVLKILGKEYSIGDSSDNDNIYLASDERNVLLQDGDSITLDSDPVDGTRTTFEKSDDKVVSIRVDFFGTTNPQYIPVGSNYIDPVFNSTNMSFGSVDGEVPLITIGGLC